MSMFATPKVGSYGDELTKDDIVGLLAVFKVTEYNPETSTQYGTTATARCHVTLVESDEDLPKRVEEGFFAAGNLGRQIGEALDVGQQAPGRIVKGTSANGRSWYGIDWATDEADLRAAEAELTSNAELHAAVEDIVATTLGGQAAATVADLKARAAKPNPDTPPPF